MIEIAVALGIIAFALVAIIGILPAGLQLQQHTRERTVIDKEADFWIEAIQNGGNYLDAYINGVTTGDDIVEFVESINGNSGPFFSAAEIIGQVSKTNGVIWFDSGGNRQMSLSEPVTAIVRPFNGSAIERGSIHRDFAFKYRMNVHITPSQSIRLDHPEYDLVQYKLWEMKLEFAWPVINGRAVRTQAVYRASIAGDVWVNDLNNPSIWFFRP